MKGNHPCFNKEDHRKYARVHIPVAPKCNVQCNFCNRKYDCINESRPGVTSAILSPLQAVEYFLKVKERVEKLAVVGIAGPGDPMANPVETIDTLRMIRQVDKDINFCISTNGLSLAEHIPELVEVGVTHLTITINSLKEQTLSKIYSWVRPSKRVYRGAEGAALLKQKQAEGLQAALDAGLDVKINTIILPGINVDEIVEMARFFKDSGVVLHNLLPLTPVEGTPFGILEEPDHVMVQQLRKEAGLFLPQMSHCQRCRADAVGLLGQKNPEELTQALQDISAGVPTEKRPYVAVCSREGFLINQHLGEAETIHIYHQNHGQVELLERRAAPVKGLGDERWKDLALTLKDCGAILVSGIGQKPKEVLMQAGLSVHLVEGLVSGGVNRIFNRESLDSMKPRKSFSCGSGCQGNAQGCG